MNKVLNIVIIGSGNVAWHLAESFSKNKKFKVLQVFNHKKTKSAQLFAKHFCINLVSNYNDIIPSADVYIIAIKDEAIKDMAKKISSLQLNGLVVHTSGSIDLSILKPASKHIGVYYPLQTFHKNSIINWKETPILIEANSTKNAQLLKTIATQISNSVKVVNSEKRLQIHLAAVFANNFTNALYAVAFQIIGQQLSAKEVKLLYPIMKYAFQKLETSHPIAIQTGPAKRKDNVTIKKHLNILKNNPQLLKVYKALSDLIVTQQETQYGKL